MAERDFKRAISAWDDADGIRLPRRSQHIQYFITTCCVGSSGKEKIVHYDFAKLVRYTALATMFTRGTLFRLDKAIYIQMAAYAVAFLLAFTLLFWSGETRSFEANSLDPILDISDNVQKFCPFLFGMFVSIILGRWWSIRTQAVGAIADHIMNISGMMVGMGARILQEDSDWILFRSLHIRFVKYGLASLSAVAQESRHDVNFWHEMVDLGILTEAETTLLQETSNTAVVLWCWMSAVGAEVLEMLKIPPPNYNVFFQEIRFGVMGIHELHQHLQTQLPFPYVHMITLLVNVNNLVISSAAGLKFAIAFEKSQAVVCFTEVCQFLLVPLLYQGLLQICVFLSDPMGNDIIDFPIREYQVEINDTCHDQVVFTRQLYDLRRRSGLSPLPNSHVIWSLPTPPSPAKAPPAPAPGPPPAPPVALPPAGAGAAPDLLSAEMDHRFEHVVDRVSNAIARGMAYATELHRERGRGTTKEIVAGATLKKAALKE